MTTEQKTINEEKKESRSEVYLDFDGKGADMEERVLIPADTYTGTIERIESFEGKEFEHPEKTKVKFVFMLKLEGENSDDAVIPLYANPVVKKASGTKGYSNSKLYDILYEAGELENAKAQGDAIATYEGLLVFLNSTLVGRKCRVTVETANKGKENAYSTAKKIQRFEKKGAK